MIAQIAWLDRRFDFDQPVGVFPPLLERLRGTPARARELIADISENILATRRNGKWSAKEHLGHLVDLQALDERRLCEFLRGAEVLSSADVENRTTESANHGSVPIAKIIKQLSTGREQLMRRLEVLNENEVTHAAMHPRLKIPMRLLDWLYFLAEHDDHHLALARSAIVSLPLERPQEKL
jgi:hypothetical protein